MACERNSWPLRVAEKVGNVPNENFVFTHDDYKTNGFFR